MTTLNKILLTIAIILVILGGVIFGQRLIRPTPIAIQQTPYVHVTSCELGTGVVIINGSTTSLQFSTGSFIGHADLVARVADRQGSVIGTQTAEIPTVDDGSSDYDGDDTEIFTATAEPFSIIVSIASGFFPTACAAVINTGV
jgi:hypothetical protein